MEVSETQFEASDVGEMSNEIESGGVLEFRHGRSDARRTQGCNTDHREEGAKRRVSVQARPFRRAGFVPPPMGFDKHMIYNCRSRARKKRIGRVYEKIRFDQHRECRGCTHADSTDSDSDGPPELDWTPHNSEDEGGTFRASPLV